MKRTVLRGFTALHPTVSFSMVPHFIVTCFAVTVRCRRGGGVVTWGMCCVCVCLVQEKQVQGMKEVLAAHGRLPAVSDFNSVRDRFTVSVPYAKSV